MHDASRRGNWKWKLVDIYQKIETIIPAFSSSYKRFRMADWTQSKYVATNALFYVDREFALWCGFWTVLEFALLCWSPIDPFCSMCGKANRHRWLSASDHEGELVRCGHCESTTNDQIEHMTIDLTFMSPIQELNCHHVFQKPVRIVDLTQHVLGVICHGRFRVHVLNGLVPFVHSFVRCYNVFKR